MSADSTATNIHVKDKQLLLLNNSSGLDLLSYFSHMLIGTVVLCHVNTVVLCHVNTVVLCYVNTEVLWYHSQHCSTVVC